MANVPTIDLSPFLSEGNNEDAKKKAKEIITKACSEYGFFQIVNHGIPIRLMNRGLELSKYFFELPSDEKLKSRLPGRPVIGYYKRGDHSTEKNESLTLCSLGSSFDIVLENPPEYRDVLQEMFIQFTKAGQLVEGILNDCLGLPQDFLKNYNNNRSYDVIRATRYFPELEKNKTGLMPHEDSNSITFVLQDDIGGLEIKKDGEWFPVIPSKGTLVINVSDVIQVLSNNMFKSGMHRVIQPKEKDRYSIAFFYNLHGDKWVEPLPQFTNDIGEEPKYKGYYQKDYLQMKVKQHINRPSKPEDIIHVNHYSINVATAKSSSFFG